ncbi:hypothetical protein ABZU86_31950 [Streptomyces sp. NPDC005271]|uniref:hypothetical protein n=1 Tax=unclassified Streptomyces TaxID=2593676 RepID=UPI0033AE341C
MMQAVGLAVLVLSLALTGCSKKGKKGKTRNRSHATVSSGRSVGGARAAQEMLPNHEAMPTTLSTLDGEPISRAKAPTSCKEPTGKCRGANAHGSVTYKADAGRSKVAQFDVIAYRNEKAAKRAYREWDSYINGDSHSDEFRSENINQVIGNEHIAFADLRPGKSGRHEALFRQGKYVATVAYINHEPAKVMPRTLAGLATMFAERIHQKATGETPSASAVNIPVV